MNKKRIRILYIFLSERLNSNLIKSYYCGQLISLIIICDSLGYKTKDALKLLKSLHSKPVISLLAWHLDEALYNGSSLKDASTQSYFDPLLSNYISMGNYTGEFINLLNSYVSTNELNLSCAVNVITLSISSITLCITPISLRLLK